MKISKYTFMFDVDGKEFYLYNTLSNSLIEVEADLYVLLKNKQQNNLYICENEITAESLEDLKSRNFITDNETDDYLIYKSIILGQRALKDSMHLTLAPTMDCCFRCHYCFEKYKEKKYMTPEVMDAIIKHISLKKDLKSIKLTWFGGEPLMALNQIEEFYYL